MASPSADAMDDDKKKSKAVVFRFCRECSNMLYPNEEGNELLFVCKSCNYKEPAVNALTYRNALKEEVQETAGNVLDVAQDPTLPHSDDECAKCHARDAVFFQSQQRNAQTGMALFFVCCECNHVWSTLNNDN